MWKVVLGFLALAALALFVLMQGGEGINMGGDSHSIEVPAAATPAASAEAPASAASR